MKIHLIFFLVISIYCILRQSSEDRGWKGIVPLHSSRADVIEKLGAPNGLPVSQYSFEDLSVNFAYSLKPCDAGWNVPADTVLRITVDIKKNRPTLSELNLDMQKYEERIDRELPDIIYLKNVKLGITYVVWKKEVQSIYYEPSAEDENLKCKSNR